MLNTALLDDFIVKSGKKREFLAEKCGLTRQGFYMKCKGINEFTLKEANILCHEIGVETLEDKERIFFAPDVE